MSDPSLDAALDRLDRAVGRIERIEPAAPAPTSTDALAGLDARHGLLRRRVQAAIEQLDALIAGDAG